MRLKDHRLPFSDRSWLVLKGKNTRLPHHLHAILSLCPGFQGNNSPTVVSSQDPPPTQKFPTAAKLSDKKRAISRNRSAHFRDVGEMQRLSYACSPLPLPCVPHTHTYTHTATWPHSHAL